MTTIYDRNHTTRRYWRLPVRCLCVVALILLQQCHADAVAENIQPQEKDPQKKQQQEENDPSSSLTGGPNQRRRAFNGALSDLANIVGDTIDTIASYVEDVAGPLPSRPPNIPWSPPTRPPTRFPTPLPTTPLPTDFPTLFPTPLPTAAPSPAPTRSPTPLPTKSPTHFPTPFPTQFPTASPTPAPTPKPSAAPIQTVTISTIAPTPAPTPAPTAVKEPDRTAATPSGCQFEQPNGSTLHFTEGYSMGDHNALTTCKNGEVDDFPCFCISRAANQTSCPYCVWEDYFGGTMCGRNGQTVGVYFNNESFVQCQCNVYAKAVGGSFDVRVASNCPMIGDEEAADGKSLDQDAPSDDEDKDESTPATNPPTQWPTKQPTNLPTKEPTKSPTKEPTKQPTQHPTGEPTASPTTPTPSPPLKETGMEGVTFVLGRLNVMENDLLLSEGLTAKVIAQSGVKVTYANGDVSKTRFHPNNKGAAVFPDSRWFNEGGWIYCSSVFAEDGGVASLAFDKDGNVVFYNALLTGSSWNNNGGETPWGTFVTVEEDRQQMKGRAVQVDPFGQINPQLVSMANDGGAWDSFGFYVLDMNNPQFFMTEHSVFGCLRRFRPSSSTLSFDTLTGDGEVDFLLLHPVDEDGGTFSWTTDKLQAKINAARHYPLSQGMIVDKEKLFFVTKWTQKLYTLDLDLGTYTVSSTLHGLMDGEPDQLEMVHGDQGAESLLFMTENNGRRSGIHVRNEEGYFYTILEDSSETQIGGMALSPDGKHLYFSAQNKGLLFDVTRLDGLSFREKRFYNDDYHHDKDGLELTPSQAVPSPVAPSPAAPVVTQTDTKEFENTDTTESSEITYHPGLLNTYEEGLLLSDGLTAKIIARSNQQVNYGVPNENGRLKSTARYHRRPDGAAIIPDTRDSNTGGWLYISNSEAQNGGVGVVAFNKEGQVIDYQMRLVGTSWNCNGGLTPWGTWISCEEDFDFANGKAWQVDPYGIKEPEVIQLGSEGGVWEAFAYDRRNSSEPRFFLTEDDKNGALQRFTVEQPDWNDPWEILHSQGGNTEYLILNEVDWNGGTFEWTTDRDQARKNAAKMYPYSEGIHVADNTGTLYFICKGLDVVFILDLDAGTYTFQNTWQNLFDGGPDQVGSLLKDDGSTMLYFSEDGGDSAGIHAMNENNEWFPILEGTDWSSETTGIAFSPDGKHLYFQVQDDGVLFDVTRKDGRSFRAKTLNIKARRQRKRMRRD